MGGNTGDYGGETTLLLDKAERCFRLARAIGDEAAHAALHAYGLELLGKAKRSGDDLGSSCETESSPPARERAG